MLKAVYPNTWETMIKKEMHPGTCFCHNVRNFWLTICPTDCTTSNEVQANEQYVTRRNFLEVVRLFFCRFPEDQDVTSTAFHVEYFEFSCLYRLSSLKAARRMCNATGRKNGCHSRNIWFKKVLPNLCLSIRFRKCYQTS